MMICKGGGKMCTKRRVCALLAWMLIIGTISIPADAVKINLPTDESCEISSENYPISGFFYSNIPVRSKVLANSSFPLVAGDTITIKASYSPFSPSVDFGLVAPDRTFYYFNISNGSIDRTIQVDQSGNYTLQIRNNADTEVTVTGFVSY